MDRRSFALVALLCGLTALLARSLGPGPQRLEVGAFEGGLVGGGWGRSDRLDLEPHAVADGATSFYYRPAPPNATLRLPVVPLGDLRLTLRAATNVRTEILVFAHGVRAAALPIHPGPWAQLSALVPAPALRGEAVDLALALQPRPLVRGSHVEDPKLLVDFFELESQAGLRLSRSFRAAVAAVPLVLWCFALLIGGSPRAALLLALASSACAIGLARLSPFSLWLALPRLLPAALLAGALAHRLLRAVPSTGQAQAPARPATRTLLSALVAAGVLVHGSLSFFPDHNPPDVDIHVRRTLDLGGLPLDYQALLRYSSQLPTASQDQGAATAALGERTLIPYSPLPYLAYYALHLLGLDLYWAMAVFNAALAMLVAPALFVAGRRTWSEDAGWIAALLYSLDLAVWHHAGRSHAPAVFGGALATAALLLLLAEVDSLGASRRAAAAGLALAAGALGYSSLAVLLGLFGLLLLALLALDARGLCAAARRGAFVALVLGGSLAGVLLYFHFVPGLLEGARGVEAEPDLFPGRTFLIFHNESRQSMRLWALGFAWPLLLGLVAAPLALRRARRAARPVLAAWLGAWALIMALKEPMLFPKLLRWAKEDQFVSPLLCLLVAAACAAPARRGARFALAGLALFAALWLQLRDFAHHANSLRL